MELQKNNYFLFKSRILGTVELQCWKTKTVLKAACGLAGRFKCDYISKCLLGYYHPFPLAKDWVKEIQVLF